ncbi:heavy-metal-associated domain-containing protein [Desulfocicer niacini]
MEKQTFSIPNISCAHCVNAIKNELMEQKGITDVVGDPVTRNITVKFDNSQTVDKIKAILKEINYPAI